MLCLCLDLALNLTWTIYADFPDNGRSFRSHSISEALAIPRKWELPGRSILQA